MLRTASRGALVPLVPLVLGTAAFLASPAPAQVQVRWFHLIDGPAHDADVASAVAFDPAGAVVTVLRHDDGLDRQARLAKYASNGALLWSTDVLPGPEIVAALAVDSDGDVVVAGTTSVTPSSANDAFVARFAPDGARRWFRRFDGPDGLLDSAAALALGPNGTAYVPVRTTRADFAAELTVLAYAADGQPVYESVFAATHVDGLQLTDVAVDAAGNAYVTGNGGVPYPPDAILVKVDPAGGLAWQRAYPGPGGGFDIAYDVALDAGGNPHVCGLVSMGSAQSPDYGAFLAKYDPQGNLAWDVVHDDPGVGTDSFDAVGVDFEGNAVVGGRSAPGVPHFRGRVGKYGPSGALVWERFWEDDDQRIEMWTSLEIDAGGGIVVGGLAGRTLDHPAVEADAEVRRYEEDGEIGWSHSGIFATLNEDYPDAIALGPGGAVAYAGRANGFPGDPTDALVVMLRDQAVPFCFGDGSAAPCPCGNASAPGDQVGCLASTGQGSKLEDAGIASLSSDTLALSAEGLPGSIAVFVQAQLLLNGGQGAPFGDGVTCLGGVPFRLGVETVTGGLATYPGPGDLPISDRGTIIDPGVRHYQAWFRDPAAGYCTSATFNLTSGLSITWAP